MSKNTSKVRVTFMATEANIKFASDTVNAYLRRIDAVSVGISDVGVAVQEVVTNCVRHAYPDNAAGEVTMSLSIENGRTAVITVRDKGVGIPDVSKARMPLYTTSLDSSGMGFTIMESFMDFVKVTSKVDVGTTVTMRKAMMVRA